MSSSCPTPDLLAALAGKALKGRDRTVLLAHLAECRSCRDCLQFLHADSRPKRISYAPVLRKFVALLALPALALVLLVVTRFVATQRSHLSYSLVSRIPARVVAPLSIRLLTPFHRQQSNRLILQTKLGERWITLAQPFRPMEPN